MFFLLNFSSGNLDYGPDGDVKINDIWELVIDHKQVLILVSVVPFFASNIISLCHFENS